MNSGEVCFQGPRGRRRSRIWQVLLLSVLFPLWASRAENDSSALPDPEDSPLTAAQATTATPADFFVQDCGQARLEQGAQVSGCKLLAWDVPKRVAPAQQVDVEVGWLTVGGDPGDFTCATILGQWEPSQPLQVIYAGFRDAPNTIFARRASFRAPAAPGRYAVRWVLAFEANPVTSFYGTPRRSAAHPECGVWVDATFEVVSQSRTESARGPAAQSGKREDRLAEEAIHGHLEPGAPPKALTEFRLLEWSLPKTALPGEVVHSTVSWQTTAGNPSASVFVSIVAEWDPDKLLTLLHHGYQGEPGTTVAKTFSFSAPQEVGVHRLRWILTQAFRPITVFYGKDHHGADDPGIGFWAEARLEVVSTGQASLP